MFSLKDHPFAVEAFFESSLVLTFAFPVGELRLLLPACLEVDTFDEQWGFVAVAMVTTKDLRPKGFPKFMGNDFFLAGYRIFVRYKTSEGKNLRGLYILKSETDKKKMAFRGNIFTHYKYSLTDIGVQKKENEIIVRSENSGLNIHVKKGNESSSLPEGSPFADWKEARRFAGPLPFTFTFNAAKNEVLIIEGVRENWTPAPVEVLHYEVGFLKTLPCSQIILANAFLIENVPYYWKKGRKDKWRP